MSAVLRLLCCWALATFVFGPTTAIADGRIQILDSGEFVLDGSQRPPDDAAPWHPLELPDNWNLSRPDQGGFGWYRLRFELPSPSDEIYSIYVRKLSMNASFYLNGEFLSSGGTFTEPVARHWNRPLFFIIPHALLKPGRNTCK
jgi:two-component system, NarL family, sensor histidine kinase UhpB